MPLEGMCAVAELTDAVAWLQHAQAHRAHGHRAAATGSGCEVAVSGGGGRRLRRPEVVVSRRERRETEQDGVAEEVQQLPQPPL
jgi:hypothetical protein